MLPEEPYLKRSALWMITAAALVLGGLVAAVVSHFAYFPMSLILAACCFLESERNLYRHRRHVKENK